MGSFGDFLGAGAASSLISGIFGTVNGFLDRSAQNKNIDKQIAAQASENQKTREYNLNLAKMQNQWNLDQWNRENEYNTPKAQMQRLADAGLNPDLFYQNGVSGMTAASSPSMTAGAPATPQNMSALGQKKTIGQALNEGLQSSLIGSQIQLNESVARKNNAEAGGQEITNETLGEMNRATIDNLIEQKNKTVAERRQAEKMVDVLTEQCKNYEAERDKIRAEISNLTFEQFMARAEYLLDVGRFAVDSNIQFSRLKLDREKWQEEKKKLAADIYKTYVDASVSESDGFLRALDLMGKYGFSATLRKNLPRLQNFWAGDLTFEGFSADNVVSTLDEELGKAGAWIAQFLGAIVGIGGSYFLGKGKFRRKPKPKPMYPNTSSSTW